MHFLYPIPEPQVTKPELLQENKNDIVGNKTLHCGKLMDMFKKFYKDMVKMNPDVNFYATGIQTIVKSGDCHGVSD